MGRRVAPLRTSPVLLRGIHSRKGRWASWSLPLTSSTPSTPRGKLQETQVSPPAFQKGSGV